jgi:hypothetical protein
MPGFWQNGHLVCFAATKNHPGFCPAANGVEAFHARLGAYKTSKGAVQFPYNLITKITAFPGPKGLHGERHRREPPMTNEKIFAMPFANIYPLLLQKAERKGRTKAELDQVIFWLTGYDAAGLHALLENQANLREFWENAPQIHPNASKMTGTICGRRVEEITDPLMQKIRWLDKLVDELAKGKPMEKVLRN